MKMLRRIDRIGKRVIKQKLAPSLHRLALRGKRRVLAETGADYLFTVVVPIYNVEPYLEETLESIVCQTVGFRENIQLVLVNDGSPDGCGRICERYLRRYPENVVYVEQENAGVSAACNVGLSHARGAFVNFMGADDKWSEDAFEEAYVFLFTHKNVPLVAFRMIFFEAKEGNHVLNFKFSKTTTIWVHDQYDCPQLSIGGAIVRLQAVPAGGFDERLTISEDFKLLTQTILEHGCYGVSSHGKYYYRKRLSADSALNSGLCSTSWYFTTPELCYRELIEASFRKYGKVTRYVQFCIMYDLQWRIVRNTNPGFLDEGREAAYRLLLRSFLPDISDEIIAEQRDLNEIQKLYVYCEKYDIEFPDAQNRLSAQAENLVFLPFSGLKPVRIGTMASQKRVLVRFVSISSDGELVIEGDIDNLFPRERVRLEVQVNDEVYETPLFSRAYARGGRSFFEKGFLDRHCFFFSHQLNTDSAKVHMKVVVDGKPYEWTARFCHFSGLSIESSYRIEDEYVLSVTKDGGFLEIKRDAPSYQECQSLERRFMESVPQGALSEYQITLRKRVIEHRYKNCGQRIWLISDSVLRADDNGRALFTYLMMNPVAGVDPYFVLSRSSSDFNALEAIGPVVDRASQEYDYLFLLADKVISSAAEDSVIHHFDKAEPFMRDMYRFGFVFLQHGVTTNDLSEWLNRFNKNIACIVSAAQKEKEAFLKAPYGYKEDNIALTGFPRHDYLDTGRPADKIVLLMPTWRSDTVDSYDQELGVRQWSDGFVRSEYFKFYNSLINDEELLGGLKKAGYKMEFILHPAMRQQKDDFQENETVRVVSDASYPDAFQRGALLVTDYSSVAFDFALFKKPIIYVQFDKETFYDGQAYSAGYYDYYTDGFGPVVYGLREAVHAIISQVECGCIMEDKYVKRVGSFMFIPNKPRCALLVDHLLNGKTADNDCCTDIGSEKADTEEPCSSLI
ncbi:CDP-glycerol glycerophosphotransferase family protein [Raoultibacter phocaeensis]|uniref:CDP-glycerol glycerophosphotransferase family protein n=1 Tax=Raoultibacter phocaeensis TaxID=2479841 RepID=UPI00111B8AE7|nr:CDP-glycerol glycerophosphotransferase family protein [Raoultibacter phocaeensis]